MIKEHDRVVLTKDRPEQDLRAKRLKMKGAPTLVPVASAGHEL